MMTFWNKAYLHYYGYGSVWHVYERKWAKYRKSIMRSLNEALGIKLSKKRKLTKTKNSKLKNWKTYDVGGKIIYG